DSISAVMESWRELSEHHRKFDKDYLKSEEALQQAKKYSEELGPGTKETTQLTLLRDIAEGRLQSNDLQGTQDIIDEASNIKVRYPSRRAEFMIIQINLYVAQEEFTKARQLLTKTLEALQECDEIHDATTYDLKNAETGATLAERFSINQSGKIVKTLKDKLKSGIKDKVGALELNDDLLELFIKEQDRHAEETASLSRLLLSKISPNSPGFKDVKDRTNKLLSELGD
ncbi:MAG: hypothetical protein K2X81_17840, partial [Candidatus Obscuribacterales bacterium]|nr:hypothetical protein [Candidatus Obscuribacterales bacterium]